MFAKIWFISVVLLGGGGEHSHTYTHTHARTHTRTRTHTHTHTHTHTRLDSSVQGGTYALGKAHWRSALSLRSFPNVAFETVPVYVCTSDGPLVLSGRSSSASSFHASLLQAISGVMSLALCPQVVSQASQHFRSFEKQTTCEGCFARHRQTNRKTKQKQKICFICIISDRCGQDGEIVGVDFFEQ